MLISEIYDEVIAEVGGDTSDTDLQALMLTFTKGALRLLPLKSRDRTLTGILSGTLTGSTQSMDLPTGFIQEVSSESIYYLDTNRKIPIVRYQGDDFRTIWSNNITGKPKYFHIYGKTIEFDRKAETDMTIYFECIKEVSDVVAGDTFVGNDTVIACLKELIKKIYYFDYEEDSSRGKIAMAIASDLLGELDSMYMDEQFGTHVVEG